MWLYLTPQHDGFLCNTIWGLKGQAHSTDVSCLALHVLWFLWLSWIFSQYYVWYLAKDLNSLQFCIAKCDFLFVWHFSSKLMHKVMSHDTALLAKTEILLLYPNTIPWLITNSPAYCELFQNSLTWIFYNLYAFILPLSQLFWNVLQQSKSLFVHIYKIHLQWWVKLWKSFLCTFVN